MNRRNFLAAAPAVVSLPSAVAGAGVTSSPVLDAGRHIAALNLRHEQADVPHADGRVLDAIWAQIWADEKFIIAATPTTLSEAMVILMVAANNLDTATASENTGDWVDEAMQAAGRVARFMASTAGVRVEEFGGSLLLPEGAALSYAEGVA